jgi:EamA domain-containing membrane protein RarD
MARTRWQRRWATATAADRLRGAALALAFAVVALDVALAGSIPVVVIVLAASYVFVEGCYRASALVARSLFR